MFCADHAVGIHVRAEDALRVGGDQKKMDAGVEDDPHAGSCAPPIEVVHAFGSCPDRVRDHICALDEEQVVYVVGSRVAITTADSHNSSSGSCSESGRRLGFLSTGLRVTRVTCVSCSPDKRFVVVCYKALGEHGPNQAGAYATVYHMPTRPRASRVKTISYERPRRYQYQQQRDRELFESRTSGSTTSRSGSGTTGSSAGSRDAKDCKRQATPAPPTPLASDTAEFVTATFSHDARVLAMLDGSPEWTLLWFEWKTGKRLFTLQLDSPVHRCGEIKLRVSLRSGSRL